MPDPTPDQVTAYLAEVRERSDRPLGPTVGALPVSVDAVRRLLESAGDVPRLLAAVAEVSRPIAPSKARTAGTDVHGAGPHQSASRELWPCGEFQNVSWALLGEGEAL
jgi:hypothetical protein